ncbi:hypothetical protein BDD12DRAFT_822211 [Trichophaea hybrida]|nr:hypothetical protein BDD12DRAFT_822211 [Trichophaea hybrida]
MTHGGNFILSSPFLTILCGGACAHVSISIKFRHLVRWTRGGAVIEQAPRSWKAMIIWWVNSHACLECFTNDTRDAVFSTRSFGAT